MLLNTCSPKEADVLFFCGASAHVSIRQHTSAYVRPKHLLLRRQTRRTFCLSTRVTSNMSAYASICQHTSAYASIRQHTSAYRRGAPYACRQESLASLSRARLQCLGSERAGALLSPPCAAVRQHMTAYVRIRQHTPAYVSIRQPTSAYVRIRPHTSAYVSIRHLASAGEDDEVVRETEHSRELAAHLHP